MPEQPCTSRVSNTNLLNCWGTSLLSSYRSETHLNQPLCRAVCYLNLQYYTAGSSQDQTSQKDTAKMHELLSEVPLWI